MKKTNKRKFTVFADIATKNSSSFPVFIGGESTITEESLAKRLIDFASVFLLSDLQLPLEYVAICGGALRFATEHFTNPATNTKLKDIDIYFSSRSAYNNYIDKLKNNPEKYGVSDFKNKQFYAEARKTNADVCLQFIPPNKVSGKMTEQKLTNILENFDFTVTKQGVFLDEGVGKLVIFNTTTKDITTKTLRIDTAMSMPVQTLRRLVRYGSYGYTLDYNSALKIARLINAIDEVESSNSADTYGTEGGELL